MAEQIGTLPWQPYAAVVVTVVGAALIGAGLQAAAGYWHRAQTGPERAFAYLYVFRRVVVGLALVGAGLGWTLQVPGLAAAGLCIAVGEFLESTFYIEMLRWGQRHGVPWLVRDVAASEGARPGHGAAGSPR